eukprot:CAMPEP_0206590612 /NCGR_PEP_ID=MMETSP0325_2-20121206/39739_1 /ASSEMBLY_ACC=CAM_ASM_000347 /TAXON_ID=2866 /ORGANISM="Crypthecodinium cohnii, Strain Seligo" /LENGTH=46 /DNA_ID= /DNA_START= /DNA_END= /DNA_ORIENTATION=
MAAGAAAVVATEIPAQSATSAVAHLLQDSRLAAEVSGAGASVALAE